MKINNMRKLNASFVSVLLLLSTLTILAVLPTSSASSGQIEIYTIEDLDAVRNKLDGNYILMNDLDFNDDASYANPDANKAGFTTGAGWRPISGFIGVFDGNGKTISNLYIKLSDTMSVGLFGVTDSSSNISNLGLINVGITGNNRVGGLIGLNYGSVSNCYTIGTVTGNDRVGGLIGENSYIGSVSNCYVTGEVNGNTNVGGLIGRNVGYVSKCETVADVTSEGNNIGGLIGENDGRVVSECEAKGSVTGNDRVGGLIGRNYKSVSNCHTKEQGHVVGNKFVGGLIGANYAKVSHSSAELAVTGNQGVGGLIGFNYKSIKWGGLYGWAYNCYATGVVNATGNDVGGLIGYNTGKVSECYATGDVTGIKCVGGLIGRHSTQTGDFSECYATGDVKGEIHVDQLIGKIDGAIVKTRAITSNPMLDRLDSILARLLDFPIPRALLKLVFGL